MSTPTASFAACQTFVQLSLLTNLDEKTLNKAFQRQKYVKFPVKKKSGGKRLIEDPEDGLALVQRRLAYHLNQSYGFHLPDHVHGYIPKKILKTDTSRDIFSNAKTHLGRPYLLNVDLMDFFHSIDQDRFEVFMADLFPAMSPSIVKYVSKICFYKDRLPMGAPSSPVISNLITMPLDRDLAVWAANHELLYSRYVDDLSFSSYHPIDLQWLNELQAIISNHHFSVNPNKVFWYGKEQPKVVTGLIILDDEIYPTQELIDETKDNINKLKQLKRTYQHLKMLGQHKGNTTLKSRYKTLKSSVKGQLSFIERISGRENEGFQKLNKLLTQAEEANYYIEQSVYI